MNKLLLVTDFDGVFNFDASRKEYISHPDSLSRIAKATAFCRGAGYNVMWSAEAIYRLNSLKTKFNFEWLWLSTWESCTDGLADDLNAYSDGYVAWSVSQARSDEVFFRENISRKYSALKEIAKDRPVVWLEDEATVLYNSQDFNYKNLIITPNAFIGLNKHHMLEIEEYIPKHATARGNKT